MKSRLRFSRGITLLEMMTTVVIIGIVAGMAMPRFQTAWERIKIRSTSRDIVSTLRLARSMALTDKSQFGVHFDPDVRCLTLFKDLVNPTGGSFEAGDSVIRIDTLPFEFIYLGTDMTNDALVFRPNGSASFQGGGNVWAMAYSDAAAGFLSYNVLASTGRVKSHADFY